MNLTQEFLHFADSVFPDSTDREKSIILQSFAAGLSVCLANTMRISNGQNPEENMLAFMAEVQAMLAICCGPEVSKDSGEQSFSA